MILDVYEGVFLPKNLRLTLGMVFLCLESLFQHSGHWSKMLWVRGKSGIHNETLQGEWDLGWKSPRALQSKCYTENLLISALLTASMLKVRFKWSFHTIDIFQSGLLPLWFICSWKFRSCRVWVVQASNPSYSGLRQGKSRVQGQPGYRVSSSQTYTRTMHRFFWASCSCILSSDRITSSSLI